MKQTVPLVLCINNYLLLFSFITERHSYWYLLLGEQSNGKIDRVDLDGNNRRTLVRGISGQFCIALDVPGYLMYYTEYRINIIYVADLDGKKMGQLMGEYKIQQMNVLGENFRYNSLILNVKVQALRPIFCIPVDYIKWWTSIKKKHIS